MRIISTLTSCGLLLATIATSPVAAQIKAVTECYPNTTKTLCGVDSFEREKYINIAGSSKEAAQKASPEQAKYLFEELGITFGRGLGMVRSEHDALREDSSRRGYADIDYLRQTLADNATPDPEYYKEVFGANENMAIHDGHGAYPSWMRMYELREKTTHSGNFPVNTDAAGEIVANVLKYKFSDFSRPKYFEPVNEPSWLVWGEDHFVKFHTDIKRHVDQMGLNVEVGGPCMSVSNFYGNNYANTSGICDFIDDTNFELDFYSFHSYDYYTWNRETKEFEGNINSGAPIEGVFDAIASYTYNKYGKEFSYIATEHGGYMPGKSYGKPVDDVRKEAFDYYANTYFPGSGFEYELKRRSVDNFLMLSSTIANTMVFMNQPHIVKKAVPFILLDTSTWDPYYYSTLLVRDNFEKDNPNSVINPLIYFYEFFKGVEGKFTHSWCDSGDIQHLAYNNGDELILLYHNTSNESGEVQINLNDFKQKITGVTIRRVGRDDESRVPYLTENKVRNISKFAIKPQESVAIFISTKDQIQNKCKLREEANYATEQNVQFEGSYAFELNIDNPEQVEEAFLRVGISRMNNETEGIEIKLNGVALKSDPGYAAERYVGKLGYATTRVIHLPKGVVKARNSVEVSFADGGEGGVGAVVLRTLAQ